jgi:hypothetical protein
VLLPPVQAVVVAQDTIVNTWTAAAGNAVAMIDVTISSATQRIKTLAFVFMAKLQSAAQHRFVAQSIVAR